MPVQWKGGWVDLGRDDQAQLCKDASVPPRWEHAVLQKRKKMKHRVLTSTPEPPDGIQDSTGRRLR